MSHVSVDPYQVLGVRPGASLLEIARARRRLAKRYHPDRTHDAGAVERMRRINAAWEILSDPVRRRDWDMAARAGRQTASPPYRPTPQTWADATNLWPRPAGPPRAATTAGGRAGWFVLAGLSLLLALIVASGVIAALDGPSFPGRDSPVLQDNLDAPDGR